MKKIYFLLTLLISSYVYAYPQLSPSIQGSTAVIYTSNYENVGYDCSYDFTLKYIQYEQVGYQRYNGRFHINPNSGNTASVLIQTPWAASSLDFSDKPDISCVAS